MFTSITKLEKWLSNGMESYEGQMYTINISFVRPIYIVSESLGFTLVSDMNIFKEENTCFQTKPLGAEKFSTILGIKAK